MRRAAIAVLLLLAAALADGCGGDGSLSAGALRTRASAICTHTQTVSARIAMPSTADQGGTFLRRGAAEQRPALAQLRKLKPPSALRSSYTDAIGARSQELALLATDAVAIAHGADTIATFHTLATKLEPLTSLETAAWRALEIPACVPR